MEINIKGIDISAYQTNVNYKEAAKHIDFAILRACWGTNEDQMLMTHAQGLKDAGVPILGLYCFDYALNEGQILEEADCIVDLAKALNLPKSTVLWFDCEGDSVRWAKDNKINLDSKMAQKHTRIFMDRVKEAGFQTGFYSNLDWMKNRYAGFQLQDGEKFWFARYDHEPEFDSHVLQYTSSGSVPGIPGNVDMNEMKEEEPMALKKINPEEWIQDHKGKIYDIDKAYGVQCVDLFKIFLSEIGFPNPSQPIGGDGYADQIWFLRSKYKDYFTFHNGDLQKGDIVLWSKGSPECPSSHVAMFYEDSPKGGNRGVFFGSNQGWEHSTGNFVDISLTGSLGHLRYKGFTNASTKKAEPEAESGRIRVKAGHKINLRSGGPEGRVIGQLLPGDELTYDHKVVTNGHRYVISGNLYLAITPTEARSGWWADIL